MKIPTAIASLLLLLIHSALPATEDNRRKFEQATASADKAWSRGDWTGVREALAPIVAGSTLLPQWRSISQLRIAGSFIAEKRFEPALRTPPLVCRSRNGSHKSSPKPLSRQEGIVLMNNQPRHLLIVKMRTRRHDSLNCPQ